MMTYRDFFQLWTDYYFLL